MIIVTFSASFLCFIFKRFYIASIKMGSMLGKTMEDNFKKQQDFMLEMNR